MYWMGEATNFVVIIMIIKKVSGLEKSLLILTAHGGYICLLVKLLSLSFFFFCFNREFAKTIKRPFGVKYNPYTQSVQILKDTKSIASVVNELRHELDIVSDALSKMGKQLEV